MSDLSPRLDLPYLLPAQAQKHVTHNEALMRLDGVVQLVVQQVAADTPPVDPAPGAAYALGPEPTGIWAGEAAHLAIYQGAASGGGWLFLSPRPGWQLWDLEGQQMRIWDGGSWAPLPCYVTPQIGVATSADATNRLAVAAPATLLTHAGAGHQLKVNKAGSSDTASLLMQTNFSGRAEIGLAGTDDLSIKLSADGSSFTEALVLSAGATPRMRLSRADTGGDLMLAEVAGTPQFRLTATGEGMAAGSWQSGGADYAEFFEWADGNPAAQDRRGISVVLKGEMIRPARADETPIGVVSSTPALLGDADQGVWHGKYGRDAFGARLYDHHPDGTQTPRLSPDFDPNRPYTPRAQRREWAMVGLLGKLILRQGQPTAPGWRRLSQQAEGLERWLVR